MRPVRLLVLSDVHGNAHALRAVLDAAAGERIDRVLCLGDLVGYGPFPNECAATLADLGAVTVVGNHDLIAIGELTDERCGPLARRTGAWTRAALDERTRAHLAALPRTARVGDVLLAHGSIDCSGTPTSPGPSARRPAPCCAARGRASSRWTPPTRTW